MIAIIAALEEELSAIVDAAKDEGPVREEFVVGHALLFGRLGGRDVVLARSGVGKVAAASTATLLVQRADRVIMVGTAGGIGDGVHPGDIVVADELLQHDADPRPLYPRWWTHGKVTRRTDNVLTSALLAAGGEVTAGHRDDLAALGLPAPRLHCGLIISGDQFVTAREHSDGLREVLPNALAVEMESAAVAQVCDTAGVPFAVARTISDRADDDAHVDFPKFLAAVAAPYARDLVLTALSRLR